MLNNHLSENIKRPTLDLDYLLLFSSGLRIELNRTIE